MQETRRLRLQAVIQEELAQVVPQEVKDPRVPNVTFTSVEVTPDGSQATVYVSILGALAKADGDGNEDPATTKQMQDCIKGLTSAAGYLRRHLAKILTVRHIPTLIFKADRGYVNTIRVQELLKKISISNDPNESSGSNGSESGESSGAAS